ncbi:MAG: ribonuclease [Actinotalea sp.]|nr:ribonuclease [Actinotalea sp.]
MPVPRRRLRPAHLPATDGTDLAAGFAAIRAEHEVVIDFAPAVLAEAEAAAARPHTPGPSRRDLTDIAFVTIDPPGSTDLDQAMQLERAGSGYVVHYAIADTAAFVQPGGALDRATHERVETVYCPDVRVPLHPPVLSEAAASLLPDQDRPAVVWRLELDATGEVTSVAVERALVRSRAQLDYPTEQARLDAGVGPDDVLTLLTEIGTLRAALEWARGGVSLGRPEQEVVDRPDGGWALAYRAPLPIEDHNAQISLMTGIAAAGLMLRAGVGVLRTMPAAQQRDLDRLRRQARALGVPWPHDKPYGDVLAELDPTPPGTAAFLAAATALFRGAAWTPFQGSPPTDHVHGAVAAPYAHVTAPLRRLVDRYGLEVCLAAHAGTPVPAWVLQALPTLGQEMAVGVRRGAAVDRACTDLVEAAVLAGQVGRVFDGVALDERTVQLHEPAVVARTEGGDLPAGADVRVRLLGADVATRRVTFALDGDPRGTDGADVAGGTRAVAADEARSGQRGGG